MTEESRALFERALHSDDKRLHRSLAKTLNAAQSVGLSTDDISVFLPHLNDLDDALLAELARHTGEDAFPYLTAYLITLPAAKSARDFCFSRLAQQEDALQHAQMLLALLECDPARAQKRFHKFKNVSPMAARNLRLRIAFDGLLNGGEQTQRAWQTLEHAGVHILNITIHSDEERESLVWLTRLSDIENKPESIRHLYDEARQKAPKEKHRLLCAFIANVRTHTDVGEILAAQNDDLLAALLDTLSDETDIKEWQKRWDFSQPLLLAIQTHHGVAALAPLKRMLASYSVCAQRHRDKSRQREIARLLRPVALHFEEHRRPYAQSFDVRPLLPKRPKAARHLRSL